MLRSFRESAVAGGAMLGMLSLLLFFDKDLFLQLVRLKPFYFFLIGVVGLAPVWLPFIMARRLLRNGMGWQDVRRALLLEERARAEEAATLVTAPIMKLGTTGEKRGCAWLLLAMGGLALWVSLARGPDPRWSTYDALGAVGLLVGSAAALLISARTDALPPQRKARLPFTQRVLKGPVGRWLFGMAGFRLKREHRVVLPPVDEGRTEVVVGDAVEQMFDGLNPDLRRQFSEVPDIVHRLQAEAGALREREAELGRAIARAEPLKADDRGLPGRYAETREALSGSRDAVRARLTEVVGALENLRLDLIRLLAGVASRDDLTADLDHARRIGDRVEARIQAHDATVSET
jgi:hypothetical protein